MIFLLDNYDSFTYNLYDYLSQLGAEILVKRNDEITLPEIEDLSPSAIVISPGPKTPKDAGILMQVLHHFHKKLPLLGICLGYQAIGEYFGATLVHSPVPVHGKTSQLFFDENNILFKNIPQGTEVMRYHSLNITNTPSSVNIIAQTNNGEPMALQHADLPLFGMQFHPESILTQHGMQMLRNWYAACLLGNFKNRTV
ncbi:MAG: anthranilate synthase component II [Chitinophagales bacterium]